MPERGSTKHSARVDDCLEGEVETLTRGAPIEARADEWRQMEAAAEGEPEPDAVVSVDDVELRSLLAFSVRPSAFPGDRERLLEAAHEERAQQRVIDWLERLPAGRVFPTVQAVWDELGGIHEARGGTRSGPPVAAPPSAAVEQTAQPAAAVEFDRPEDHFHQTDRDHPDDGHPDDGGRTNDDQSLVCRAAHVGVAIASAVVGLAAGVARAVWRRPWS